MVFIGSNLRKVLVKLVFKSIDLTNKKFAMAAVFREKLVSI